MKKTFVLTIIGTDRPGIVQLVSSILTNHNANWLESRMSHLAGEFAGMLHAEVNESDYPPLLQDLESLQSEGLQILVKDTVQVNSRTEGATQLELEVVGNDRAGIVRDISAVLARFEINVEDFHTEFSEAPMSSAPLFKATAHLSASNEIDLDSLQQEIEAIAHDLMIEIKTPT